VDGISIISLKRKEKKLRTTSLVLIAGARELLIRWFAPSVSLQRENEMEGRTTYGEDIIETLLGVIKRQRRELEEITERAVSLENAPHVAHIPMTDFISIPVKIFKERERETEELKETLRRREDETRRVRSSLMQHMHDENEREEERKMLGDLLGWITFHRMYPTNHTILSDKDADLIGSVVRTLRREDTYQDRERIKDKIFEER